MNPILRNRRSPSFGNPSSPGDMLGVTLIEVLVAVLVLSIGLLGMASLQISGMQANHAAYERSQATILAYDAIDRMRARRDQALDGAYDTGFERAPACVIPQSLPTSPEEDVQQWRVDLVCGLSGGEGRIDVDPATGIATVTIRWTDRLREPEDPASEGETMETFTTRSRL